MQLTITIHDSWLHSADLQRFLTVCRSLESPSPVSGGAPVPAGQGHGDRRPEPPAPLNSGQQSVASGQRNRPGGQPDLTTDHRPLTTAQRGGAWEPEDDYPDEDAPAPGPEPTDDDAPRDGRQLLGWASKQEPDPKAKIIAYGKKHGFAARVIDWRPEQVSRAYLFARR